MAQPNDSRPTVLGKSATAIDPRYSTLKAKIPPASAYGGGLVLGAPSLVACWGSELLRSAAAQIQPPLDVKELERADAIGPTEAWKRTLYITRSPDASVLSVIESGTMPVLAFFDEPRDTIAYIRRSSGMSFIEALRSATAAAGVNRALFGARKALVVRRGNGSSLGELFDQILTHVHMALSATAASALKQKFCGPTASAHTLEDRLAAIAAYKRPGEWTDALSAEEADTVMKVLSPLMQMAQQERCPSIKWPNDVFLAGDRPNERAPVVAEIAGGARYLFYGPYFHLPPGTYRARLVAGFSQETVGAPFTAEVYAASTLLAKARFEPKFPGILQGDFLVIHKLPQDAVEVRFRSDDSMLDGRVGLAWVEFQYLGGSDPPAHNVP